MISAAYSAYSIASQFYPLPGSSWTQDTWRGIGVGFLAFAAFVFWGWCSTSAKLREHENTHPTAKVTPIREGYSAYLEVENTGHNRASFGVEILYWQGIERLAPEMRPYRLKWLNNLNNPNAPIHELLPSQSNRLLIIEAGGEFLDEKDPTDKSRHNAHMPSQFETRTGLVKLNDEVKVTLKVFSDPKLKTAIQRIYVLSLGVIGGYETWKRFEEEDSK